MSNEPLLKVKAATAAEICAHFTLEKEPHSLLQKDMGPREFLAALLSAKHFLAGIDFMAHALSPRDAIWWGCLCLQHACGNDFTPSDRAACKVAVRWILVPSEENRAAANAPAEAAGAASPAGGLAAAAYHTGGNIAPPKAPPASPGPFDSARAIARAVKLACTKLDPVRMADTQRLFVQLGIGVADGRFGFTEARNRSAIQQ